MPTSALIGWGWLAGQGGAWALVLARTAALAALAPAWGTPGLGGRARLVLAALLAAGVVPVVGATLAVPGEPWALVGACAVEVAVGGLLGLSAALIVAGARQAG